MWCVCVCVLRAGFCVCVCVCMCVFINRHIENGLRNGKKEFVRWSIGNYCLPAFVPLADLHILWLGLI